jgi:hypothetical protein
MQIKETPADPGAVTTEAVNHLMLRRTIYGSASLVFHGMWAIFFAVMWNQNSSNWSWVIGLAFSCFFMVMQGNRLDRMSNRTYTVKASEQVRP